jgi:hypothetical protein
MPSRSCNPLAFSFFFLLFSLGVSARPCLAAETITIDVGVVHASNSGSNTDPSLLRIQGKLDNMFDYSCYKLLERKQQKLSEGERKEFELPGKRVMRVKLISLEGKKVRLYVRIEERGKKLLGTTLGLARGGMVLVGGPVHEAGVLIFLISAD